MTIQVDSRITEAVETDGVSKRFDFNFPLFKGDDDQGLEVRFVNELGYDIVDREAYSLVVGLENKGGHVLFHVAPEAGLSLVIAGKTPLDQSLDITNPGKFFAQSVERSLDKITSMIQEFVSTLDEETRQRINNDNDLRDHLNTRFTELAASIDQRFQGKWTEMSDYLNSLLPMFFCIMRKEIEAFTNEQLPSIIDQRLSEVIDAEMDAYLDDLSHQVSQNIEAINEAAANATAAESARNEAIVAKNQIVSEIGETKNYFDEALSGFSMGAENWFPTLAAANAAIATIGVGTSVWVGDEINGGLWYKSTAGATSLTKSVYDPLTQAKKYTDDYATVKAKTLADGTNFNSIIESGEYKVASNASALTMINCPWGRAGILEVLALSNTLVIQRYTVYGIEKKLFYRASNAGAWPATWDEYLLKSVADGIYSTPATVAVAVADGSSALTSTLVQADYYGKKYTPAEQIGAGLYTNAVVAGYNSIHTKDVTFNSVNARIFNTTAGKIEYRVWTGSKVSSTVNGYRVSTQATIANPDFSGHCEYFPGADDAIDTIILDKAVSIPKNTPFVIAFKAIDSTRFSIAYASSATGNLESRSFNLATTTGDWTTYSQIANADVASGYIQAGFKLLVTLPQQSSSDDYLPELVLPPVIYAMQRTKTNEIDQTLETRIYPEHIIREDYKLYDHDVTCAKGQQRNRGFVWSATQNDPVGSYPLTWALHDKQKGTQLTSASTTIQLAALNAKSGTTQKVQVIGDSLVNAGAITQRLLDIAADDVMEIELIGTRGSGLNKHEGRGGWRINEYTGVGLSNYKFTVSGVVTVPAINSATYSFNGVTYLVQETAISGGSGYIICSVWSGTAPANPSGSGTLTKANTGVGDATIAFSNFETVPGNPFWNTSTTQIDYANYLSRFSLAAPDYVFIQLGTNDVFGITSDALVESFCATAFPKLDILINSIKAAIAGVKVIVVAPPVGSDQDAFGTSYATGQTARRFKRNMVTYNKQLYNYYGGKEAQSIYVLGSGVGVDTESNFPTSSGATNSQNATIITSQNNGVHPADSGYRQIADAWFPFMKIT